MIRRSKENNRFFKHLMEGRVRVVSPQAPVVFLKTLTMQTIVSNFLFNKKQRGWVVIVLLVVDLIDWKEDLQFLESCINVTVKWLHFTC